MASSASSSGRPLTFWLALIIVVLVIGVVILYWPKDEPLVGPPPPLTVAGAKSLDDATLVTCTSRDILWQMVGKGKALDAWRKAPDPVKNVYVLAAGGHALTIGSLLDWTLQRHARQELPSFSEIAAGYTAVGLTRIAKLLEQAAVITEKQEDAIRASLSWDPSSGTSRPADPFARIQGDLHHALQGTDCTKPVATYIKAHATELLAPDDTH